MSRKEKQIEVADVTLRDGEQTPGVSFRPKQKLAYVINALTQLMVDRIEVTSALVSEGEKQMLATVMEWATKHGFADRIEVLGFVDGKKSVDWIRSGGGKVMNLLCKGSLKHCEGQLRKSLEQHLADIEITVKYAISHGLMVNVYLEDWSQGMLNSPQYVKKLLAGLAKLPISRAMLCDTMGVLSPWQVADFITQTSRWQPKLRYDFHGHNDYGLAVANSLAAVKTGAISGVHLTVNGLGERAGNAALDEVVVGITDHLRGFCTGVQEAHLRPASQVVAMMSGRRVSPSKPIAGNVFVTTAGVHVDGDLKAGLYVHPCLTAGRLGIRVEHSLGKLSGKASIRSNAARFGLTLNDEEINAVSTRVTKLGDEGKPVTIADLPYIIAEVLNRPDVIVFRVEHATTQSTIGRRATAAATIVYYKRQYEISAHGDGGFDAFMNALVKWAKQHKISVPKLIDYDLKIPPGGTYAAIVQANIRWKGPNGEGEFQTVGLDTDQVMAAIYAAEAAINICNQNHHQ
ncbi:MAG: alpha-isopropylmalate synthase regulatory domain-containing protein [Patescibacteria group bacterium]